MGINRRRVMNVLAIASVLALGSAGCGAGAISPQLQGARAVLQEARESSAAELEPDQLAVAQQTLTVAENETDGSPREMHYAYIAERQARAAMADARRRASEQGMAQGDQEFRAELSRIARERGTELESTERELESTQRELQERERMMQQQQAQLEERERALSAEQQARRDAEANAQAAMTRVAEVCNVRQEATQTVITIPGEVLFESASATLRPEARSRLATVAEALQAAPERTAVIAGYTDSRGSSDRNRTLSQRRAESVRDFLVAEGVPNDRIRAEGRGEISPVATNDSAEGRANNRRVEIIVQPVTTTTPITPGSMDQPMTPGSTTDRPTTPGARRPRSTEPPMAPESMERPTTPGSTQRPTTPGSTERPNTGTPTTPPARRPSTTTPAVPTPPATAVPPSTTTPPSTTIPPATTIPDPMAPSSDPAVPRRHTTPPSSAPPTSEPPSSIPPATP